MATLQVTTSGKFAEVHNKEVMVISYIGHPGYSKGVMTTQ